MNRTKSLLTLAALTVLATGSLATPAAAAGPEIASVSAGATAIVWQPAIAYERMVLTVSGPDGVFSQEFDSATMPALDLYDAEGYPLADGSYNWELRAQPAISDEVRQAMAEARATGDYSRIDALRSAGHLPSEPMVLSGAFRVHEGSLVGDADEAAGATDTGAPVSTSGAVTSMSDAQVITGDLTVYNSLCVGVDCATAESYGADTIRLKENNLRIHFNDTSNSASFPSNDWRLVANESGNGGRNVFYLEDSDAGTQVFSVEAGAGNNAVYVDDAGFVGFGTSTPAVDLHVKTGNTPTLRLDQDGSSGFTPQVWDLAGNEANFFVRDVTNSSFLPFRIEPGTATNTLYLDNQERVGIGTNSPTTTFHVRRTDGTALARIEEASATAAARNLLELTNNGGVRISLEDTSSGGNNEWFIRNLNAQFQIVDEVAGDGNEFIFAANGDFTAAGAKNFAVIDPEDDSRAIYYAALEGPEAGTYYRGTAKTVDGEAVIEMPRHFTKVTEKDGMTVQLTPVGGWNQLFVVEKTPERLVVRTAGEEKAVEFDFLVQGIRMGYSDYEVERDSAALKGELY